MTTEFNLNYDGKMQPDEIYNGDWVKDPYHPTPELKEAVNLAIFLKRPLLIKGVPGCGKTRLADAVRLELTRNNEGKTIGIDKTTGKEIIAGRNSAWPMYRWEVKSTSEVGEGLYTYDAIGRLHDAQLKEAGKMTENRRDPSSPEPYIKLGELGKSLDRQICRPLVLIDEIDKADIDFPNDLLTVLEEKSFVVGETGKEIGVEENMDPIIFITSNDEKELPDAFLRRCVFYYIEFPDDALLKKIIHSRFQNSDKLTDELVDKILERFNELRDERISATKEEGTSELLDWVNVLLNYGDSDDLIALLDGRLPYLSVLVKNWEKHEAYLRKHPGKELQQKQTDENG